MVATFSKRLWNFVQYTCSRLHFHIYILPDFTPRLQILFDRSIESSCRPKITGRIYNITAQQ